VEAEVQGLALDGGRDAHHLAASIGHGDLDVLGLTFVAFTGLAAAEVSPWVPWSQIVSAGPSRTPAPSGRWRLGGRRRQPQRRLARPVGDLHDQLVASPWFTASGGSPPKSLESFTPASWRTLARRWVSRGAFFHPRSPVAAQVPQLSSPPDPAQTRSARFRAFFTTGCDHHAVDG
jgi:hypothetical protein